MWDGQWECARCVRLDFREVLLNVTTDKVYENRGGVWIPGVRSAGWL